MAAMALFPAVKKRVIEDRTLRKPREVSIPAKTAPESTPVEATAPGVFTNPGAQPYYKQAVGYMSKG